MSDSRLPVRRALLSVSDKTGLLELARALAARNVELLSTGGTAKAIRELYPKAKFIAIFAKPMGEQLLDDFEVAIPQDTWIEQPWDMALEFANPICDEE